MYKIKSSGYEHGVKRVRICSSSIALVGGMDLIQSELCNFDLICISESWLDSETSDDDIKIENFKLFRRDRSVDHHGGICVYVPNNVFFQKKIRS